MATVYKKITTTELSNRSVSVSSNDEKSKASTILNTFVNLFKQKHLS